MLVPELWRMLSDRRGFLSDTCQKDIRANQECQHKTQNRKCWNISKQPECGFMFNNLLVSLCAKSRRCQLLGGNYFSRWDVYLAYLDRVAEQSAEGGIFLVPGQIILQTAKWNILHDQLISLTTYKWVNRRWQEGKEGREEGRVQGRNLRGIVIWTAIIFLSKPWRSN